jgi:5'-deoxynucleotidase YfbR-like HD superfamily hydrolase
MVSNNNTPCDARVLLLHDAAEAFLSDIAAPVKHEFLGRGGEAGRFWKEAEERITTTIMEKYIPEWLDIVDTVKADYHPMDIRVRVAEMRQLLPGGIEDCQGEPSNDIGVIRWTPEISYLTFLGTAGGLKLKD